MVWLYICLDELYMYDLYTCMYVFMHTNVAGNTYMQTNTSTYVAVYMHIQYGMYNIDTYLQRYADMYACIWNLYSTLSGISQSCLVTDYNVLRY